MAKKLDEATLTILRDGTEAQLRELDMPWPHTEVELGKIIAVLVNRQNDYGTCVYAMSIAAEAAFNFVAHKLGTTDFQANCADMDFLKRIRGYKSGFAILNYENLLYPQYREKFDRYQFDALIAENKEELRDVARELLAKNKNPHPDVKSHWERIAA